MSGFMDEPTDKRESIRRLSGWVRLLAILFRLVIILALLLFVLIILGLILTSFFKVWFLILPVGMLTVGIILARTEYHLHGKLYELKNQALQQQELGKENYEL